MNDEIIFAFLTIAVVFAFCFGLLFYNSRKRKKQEKKRRYPGALPSFFDPEAGKLPYVYYPSPVEQVKQRIKYVSPYLGIEQEIMYRPRDASGKAFDNVRGIAVSENLTLLREIIIHGTFPGDVRKILKHFPGRLPTEAEVKQIFEKRAMICNNLLECGEPLLLDRKYLYTCGDDEKDDIYNYCLHFTAGDICIADCDSYVSAFLVE